MSDAPKAVDRSDLQGLSLSEIVLICSTIPNGHSWLELLGVAPPFRTEEVQASGISALVSRGLLDLSTHALAGPAAGLAKVAGSAEWVADMVWPARGGGFGRMVAARGASVTLILRLETPCVWWVARSRDAVAPAQALTAALESTFALESTNVALVLGDGFAADNRRQLLLEATDSTVTATAVDGTRKKMPSNELCRFIEDELVTLDRPGVGSLQDGHDRPDGGNSAGVPAAAEPAP